MQVADGLQHSKGYAVREQIGEGMGCFVLWEAYDEIGVPRRCR